MKSYESKVFLFTTLHLMLLTRSLGSSWLVEPWVCFLNFGPSSLLPIRPPNLAFILSLSIGILTFIVSHKAPQKNCQDRWLWVNSDFIGLGYPCVPITSDQTPQLLGTSFSLAQALNRIRFKREDWQDCILAVVGMSPTWQA